MNVLTYSIQRLLFSIPTMIGVTLISFFLMVYCGPDKTYDLLGKNPTKEQIKEVRHKLGYDKPFLSRYVDYLKEIVTLDFGHSYSNNEKVISIFKRTIPISLALSLPSFFIGNILSIIIAIVAAYYRGTLFDRIIMCGSVVGMSISFLIVLIVFQYVFCSSFGLNIFPIQGWEINSFRDYIFYVTVPTMVTVFVALGYNTRFYRTVIANELTKDHIKTVKSFGIHPFKILFKVVLKNSLIPILTRIIITLPFIIIGGCLLIENFFGIPGIGDVTYNAITTGDLPIVKAVVSVTSLVYILALILTDIIYKTIDPRVSLG